MGRYYTVLFKEKVRNYINETGCSYRQAAEYFDIDHSTVSKIMNYQNVYNDLEDRLRRARHARHKSLWEDAVVYTLCNSGYMPHNRNLFELLEELDTHKAFEELSYSIEDLYLDDIDLDEELFVGVFVGAKPKEEANKPKVKLERISPAIAFELGYGKECYEALMLAETAEAQQRILRYYRRKAK